METVITNYVELPVPLQGTITMLIVSGVALLVNWIIVRVPFLAFLAPYAREWGLGLAAAFLMFFQNAIPDQFAQIAIYALELVMAILALFLGAVKFLARRHVQGFVSE